MTDVPIYNADGLQVDSLAIPDDLTFGYERVAKTNRGYFYKGVGVIYKAHWFEPDKLLPEDYRLVKLSDVFYVGPLVAKKCFEGKIGVFQEKYQPQFSDFIGTCGVKELSVLENEDFALSSMQVLDSVNYNKVNGQYYFRVNYLCNRIKYKECGNPRDLYRLLEYMIKEGWNFTWDKDAINDISFNGLVTDVADLYRSKDLKSRLGTAYSVIYSLGKYNFNLYQEFVHVNKLIPHMNDMYYVFNAAELVKRFGADIKELWTYGDIKDIYKNIVYNYLTEAKNCGDCCMVELGDKIREQYKANALKQWKEV